MNETSISPEQGAVESTPKLSLMARLGVRLARAVQHPAAPMAFGAVVIGGALLFFANHQGWLKGGALVGRTSGFVVFDPVRFVNSQRAAASLLAARPDADLSLTITQVAKQAEQVIQEEAGGAIVLIKQAVVVPDALPDITDAVLNRFGLPTNVPTVSTNPGKVLLENLAPTDSVLSTERLRDDYRQELQQRSAAAAAAAEKAASQQDVLP